MERTELIAVIGGSTPSDDSLAMAERVGHLLADQGMGVVCGGLSGIMEAVCRGARESGGLTVGILPTSRAEDANPYVQVVIPTGIGIARNPVVVRSGKAVIAIDGSYGTLTEIAFALAEDIPVIALDSWEIAIGGQNETKIHRAKSPEDAVEMALKLARSADVQT